MNRTWTLIVAGLMTGGLGLHLIVTLPLNRRIDRLSAVVDGLQSGMRQVADYRDEVAGTNDLLSGLETQSRRITQARTAMESVRMLEREVRMQAAAAADARAVLTEIARLHAEVIAQSEQLVAMHGTLDQLRQYQDRADRMAASAQQAVADIEQAEESLRQLGDFHQRVAVEASGINIAENRFEQLVGLKHSIEEVAPTKISAAEERLVDLSGVVDQIIVGGRQAEEARDITGHLIALQDDVVSRGTRASIARKHAEQLLTLESTLANNAGRDIDAAVANLTSLLEIEERLATQDQRLAAAIESLELIEDLQTEFSERTKELDGLRRGLTEIVMMESMVARSVRALQPLCELTDLRRLDSAQLRSVARGMIGSGHQRVAASEVDSPTSDPTVVQPDADIRPSEAEIVPIPPAE